MPGTFSTELRTSKAPEPVRLHRIVWDTRRDRPAGEHLQQLAGCGNVADWFPVDCRIEIATPDMDLFLVTDEQLAALATRQQLVTAA